MATYFQARSVSRALNRFMPGGSMHDAAHRNCINQYIRFVSRDEDDHIVLERDPEHIAGRLVLALNNWGDPEVRRELPGLLQSARRIIRNIKLNCF